MKNVKRNCGFSKWSTY